MIWLEIKSLYIRPHRGEYCLGGDSYYLGRQELLLIVAAGIIA